MARATRRQVIVASAMLALSPAGFALSQSAEYRRDQDLISLGLELERQKRRVRNLYRQWQQQDTPSVWTAWSDARADLERLCERIACVSATTLQGIAVRYEALAVGLLDDDVIMDETIRRQAVLLRRSLACVVSA